MSFGAAVGGSALGGLMTNAMSTVDNFHDFEAENNLWIDWFGTGLGKINAHAERKKAKKQQAYARYMAELEYQYQKRAALEMPALVRKGYEDAGYNALLALGNTGGVVNAAPKISDGSGYPHEISRRNEQMDMMVMSALQQQAAQIEKTKAETTRTKVSTVKDVLAGLGGALGGAIGLRALSKKAGLLAAMTTNAAQGSPVHRAAAAAAAARSARMLNNIGKFGSAASFVGLIALLNELGNIAKSKGLPTAIPSSAHDKANEIRFGKPSNDPSDYRRLNFDAIRKNKRWSH